MNTRQTKTDIKTVRDQLEQISKMQPSSVTFHRAVSGRNIFTRSLDAVLHWVRDHLPPIHWFGAILTAGTLFLYARLVARTARLRSTSECSWPNVPTPSVIALWHRDAPALLVAFAKRPLPVRTVIMIARDPRGDYIARLCRWLGFAVVRGASHEGGWDALVQLADHLIKGDCVILTADGGGPARVAKIGAVALASATGVPLIPIAVDCQPAISEPHKWDSARNPIPFCTLTVTVGPGRRLDVLQDPSTIEEARAWLEEMLNGL